MIMFSRFWPLWEQPKKIAKERFNWFKTKVKNPFQSLEDFKEWFDDFRVKDFSLRGRLKRYTEVGNIEGVSFKHPSGKRNFEGLNDHYRFYLRRYNEALLKVDKRIKSKFYKDRFLASKKGKKEAVEYITFVSNFKKYLLNKKREIERFLK